MKYIAVCLLALLVLSGCEQQLDPFIIYVKDDVETALQIDLVAVNDNAVGALLHSAGGEGWFSNKPAFLSQYSDVIAVQHYELVPSDARSDAAWPSLSGATMFMIAINYPDQPKFMALDARTVREIAVGRRGIEVRTW